MSSLRPSPIAPTVDFDKDGVQHGFLRLPYSRDDSAWGSVMIPICVIRNGKGPTALLTGGNHGDEYEGPLALYDLARTLDPKEVSGTVIIVPAMNYPAFRAGTRTSPIDKGNMNRSFPGRPDGTVTEKIADYFQRELLPRADIVLRLPFRRQDARLRAVLRRAHSARQGAGAESLRRGRGVLGPVLDAACSRSTPSACTTRRPRRWARSSSRTELGGGGTSRAQTVRIARRGISNVLRHAGIVDGAVEKAQNAWLDMPSGDCFSFAEDDGMIETMVDLGEPVEEGAVLARIHSDRPHRRRAAGDPGKNVRHAGGAAFPRPGQSRRLRRGPGRFGFIVISQSTPREYQSVWIQTDLVSRYSCRCSMPPSRP